MPKPAHERSALVVDTANPNGAGGGGMARTVAVFALGLVAGLCVSVVGGMPALMPALSGSSKEHTGASFES